MIVGGVCGGEDGVVGGFVVVFEGSRGERGRGVRANRVGGCGGC